MKHGRKYDGGPFTTIRTMLENREVKAFLPFSYETIITSSLDIIMKYICMWKTFFLENNDYLLPPPRAGSDRADERIRARFVCQMTV